MHNSKEMDYFQLYLEKDLENQELNKRLATSEQMVEEIQLKFSDLVSSLRSLGSSLDLFRSNQSKTSNDINEDADEGISASEMWSWDTSEHKPNDQNIRISSVESIAPSIFLPQDSLSEDRIKFDDPPPTRTNIVPGERVLNMKFLSSEKKLLYLNGLNHCIRNGDLYHERSSSEAIDINSSEPFYIRNQCSTMMDSRCITEEGLQFKDAYRFPKSKVRLPTYDCKSEPFVDSTDEISIIECNTYNSLMNYELAGTNGAFEPEVELLIENEDGKAPEAFQDFLEAKNRLSLYKYLARSQTNEVVPKINNYLWDPTTSVAKSAKTWTPPVGKTFHPMDTVSLNEKCQISAPNSLSLGSKSKNLTTSTNQPLAVSGYSYSARRQLLKTEGNCLNGQRKPGPAFLNNLPKNIRSPNKKQHILPDEKTGQEMSEETRNTCKKICKERILYVDMTKNNTLYKNKNQDTGSHGSKPNSEIFTTNISQLGQDLQYAVSTIGSYPIYPVNGIVSQGYLSTAINPAMLGQVHMKKESETENLRKQRLFYAGMVPINNNVEFQPGYRFILPKGDDHSWSGSNYSGTTTSGNERLENGLAVEACYSPECSVALSGIKRELNSPLMLKTLLSSSSTAHELQGQYEGLQRSTESGITAVDICALRPERENLNSNISATTDIRDTGPIGSHETPNQGTNIDLSCSGCWRCYKYFGTPNDPALHELFCFVCKQQLIPRIDIAERPPFEDHSATDPTLQCSICQVFLTSHKHIEAHMKAIHGVKPFKCVICGKLFREKRYLKSHSNIHLAQLPYRCTVCSKTFATPSKLRYHSKLSHTGEMKYPIAKRYKCKYCSIKFRYKKSLEKHIQYHKSGLPHLMGNDGEEFNICQ